MIEATVQEMKDFTAMYNKPLYNVILTFTEPFPVGLIITLVSAAILREARPSTCGAGDSIKPGVERSGTPGQRGMRAREAGDSGPD